MLETLSSIAIFILCDIAIAIVLAVLGLALGIVKIAFEIFPELYYVIGACLLIALLLILAVLPLFVE